MKTLNRLFVAFAVCTLLSLLGACAHQQIPVDPDPVVEASCPPLTPLPQRMDEDARNLHIAELRSWYQTCRDARLAMPKAADPKGFTGFGSVNGVVSGR